jgi:FkbM family methyltransferase
MRALLRGVESPVIFDVGAHYGNVTAMLLRIWPTARIHCFEPEPEGLAELRLRFEHDDRVTIVPLALGSRQGKSKFYVCGQGTEMSSLLPRGEWMGRRYYRHETREVIEVEIDTLDHYMEMSGIDTVHLVKMDVQGGEKNVLRGSSAVLAGHCFWAIYSEILFTALYNKAALFWELCRQLDKYGYTVFDVYNLQRSWINRQLKYGDALWVGPTLRAKLNEYPEEWLKKSLTSRMCPNR